MTDDHRMERDAAVQETASRRTLWMGAAAAALLAWATYRPDRERPFRIVDFSEFLPLLERGGDVLGRTRELVAYYQAQGRFNVIPYALQSAKWSLFGDWSPGWQLSRAGMMLLLVALTYLLLRRLGASRLGGAMGASVYLWAPSASDGWVHLTMAEPLGAALMLGASLVAAQFQKSDHWRRDVAIIALSSATLIFTKELLAPLILLPLAVATLVQRDSSMAHPRITRRNIWLVGTVGAVCTAASIPILLLYLRAEDSAYAALYGQAPQSVLILVAAWVAALIPFNLVPSPASVPWALAVTAFTILVAAGWRVGFQNSEEGDRARWLLAVAIIVPLAGVMAYLPSPWYARFYTLPYLIGAALFTGMAATYLERHVPRGTAWAAFGWGASTLFALSAAGEHATVTEARQRRDSTVVARVAELGRAERVLYATVRPPPYPWLGIGATLRRYANATGHAWPPTSDISCQAAKDSLDARGSAVVIGLLEDGCQLDVEPAAIVSTRYRRMDWQQWRVVVDSAAAFIVAPPRLLGAARP